MKRIVTYKGYLDEAKLGHCLVELFPNSSGGFKCSQCAFGQMKQK